MTFHNIGNVIIPTDEIIFFRGVAQPPTRCLFLRLPHDIGWELYGIKSYQKKYSTARRHCKWWTGLGESSQTAELYPKSIGFRWYHLATRLWFGANIGSLSLSHVKTILYHVQIFLQGWLGSGKEYETADVLLNVVCKKTWYTGDGMAAKHLRTVEVILIFSEHHVKWILEWCINMVLPSHYHVC